MLDRAASGFVVEPAPGLPIEAMVRGKPCAEVAELLPRLFNLCRTAQELAARLAFGLPVVDRDDALGCEILRDHVLKLSVVLPGHFGAAPLPLPTGWQVGGDTLRSTLFGPTGELPERPDDLEPFLSGGAAIGALWARLREMFAVGEACCAVLPPVTTDTAAIPKAPVENSVALRNAAHPVVASVEKAFGRGPLWRVVGRSYDLEARLNKAPLMSVTPERGVAHVAATRGLFTVKADVVEGRVQSLTRVTPTDHLQAPGGMLSQTLTSLSPERAGVVPLLMDILDPCVPLRVREVAHA